MDRLPAGLIGRLGAWSAALLLLAVLTAVFQDRALAVGIALGGALALALLGLHRALAPALLTSPRRRVVRAAFWTVWAVKWPLICALLYVVFRHHLASPAGIAIGVGILPAVATLLALRALLTDLWLGDHTR
jgi:hypothetical protein